MKHSVTIAYRAQDLEGKGHELLLDRVNGTMIGEFLNGELFPSLTEINSSDLKLQCATLKDERTLVLAA